MPRKKTKYKTWFNKVLKIDDPKLLGGNRRAFITALAFYADQDDPEIKNDLMQLLLGQFGSKSRNSKNDPQELISPENVDTSARNTSRAVKQALAEALQGSKKDETVPSTESRDG